MPLGAAGVAPGIHRERHDGGAIVVVGVEVDHVPGIAASPEIFQSRHTPRFPAQ